jgi:hypothetical protein
LADHQAKAERISDFHLSLVPTLLRTTGHAEAVRARNVVVRESVSAPLVGRRLCETDPLPRCTFLIAEAALRLPVGSPVMSEQWHHLLEMAVRPTVSILVIPTAVGAHAGMAGSCCVMEFAEFEPVAYVEAPTEGLFLETPAEVSAIGRIITALTAVAWDAHGRGRYPGTGRATARTKMLAAAPRK